jgi:DNA-binding NarL/FixJ family response regulator
VAATRRQRDGGSALMPGPQGCMHRIVRRRAATLRPPAVLGTQPDFEVVAEAATGREAVDLARTHRPNVVLMDVRMPDLDGIAATAEICRDARTRSRVLILTTFDLDEYVLAALRAGASGFLLKDAPRDALYAAVRTVAAGDALLAPSVTRRLIERHLRLDQPSPQARRGPGPDDRPGSARCSSSSPVACPTPRSPLGCT